MASMLPVASQAGCAGAARTHLLVSLQGSMRQAKIGRERTPVIGADLGAPAEGNQAAARRHCAPGTAGEQLKARLLRVLHRDATSHHMQLQAEGHRQKHIRLCYQSTILISSITYKSLVGYCYFESAPAWALPPVLAVKGCEGLRLPETAQ